MEAIEVDYVELLRNAGTIVPELIEFVGPERLPRSEQVIAAIDIALWKKRGEQRLLTE